jgi:hypothetical protein
MKTKNCKRPIVSRRDLCMKLNSKNCKASMLKNDAYTLTAEGVILMVAMFIGGIKFLHHLTR